MKNVEALTCSLPNGEEIFYRSYGEGDETFLLLHGNLSSSLFMEPFFPYLKGCRIIAPDMRGYGDSSYRGRIDSLLDLAKDLSMFCDELKLASIFAGGWSTGGAVSLELAALRPDLVKGIVLISSVSCQGFPIPPKDENGFPIPGGVYPDRQSFNQDPLVSLIGNSLMNRDYATLRQIWDSMIFTKYRPSDEEYAAYLDAMCKQRSNNDAYWALTQINMTDEDNERAKGTGAIGRVNCPVLAFHGDEDLVLEMSQAEENKAYLGDKMELIVLENCSHASTFDYPEVISEKIISFFQEHA